MALDRSQFDGELADLGVNNISSSLDTADNAYKLQFGYQFNRNFALEGGYVNLGKYEYSATFTGGNASGNAKFKGWNVAGIGILPVNDKFSLFGKVGLIRSQVASKVDVSGAGLAATSSGNTSNWKPTWGIGATYHLTKQVGLRLEYEQFNNLGDEDFITGVADVSLVSAGAGFKF